MHTQPDKDKKFTEEDFKPYIKRRSDWDNRNILLLPNLIPLFAESAISAICYTKLPRLHGYLRYGPGVFDLNWGTIWLNTLQGGGWDGTGIVTIYRGQSPFISRFALCRHEAQLMPGANPSRGQHEQFCTKCGLDLSYDSSD